MLSHSFLSSMVSAEKSAVRIIHVPLHVVTSFFLLFSRLFSFDFQYFCYVLSVCDNLCIYFTCSLLSFLDMSVFFNKFEKFSATISLNIFSSPFSHLLLPPSCKWWHTLWCPRFLWGSLHFCSFFSLSILQFA